LPWCEGALSEANEYDRDLSASRRTRLAPKPFKVEFLPQFTSRSTEAHRCAVATVRQCFILPGTNVRFGIEALLRLVPGIGDVAASTLSAYLLYEAHRLGVPGHIFARLAANVAIEGVVGAVPLIGDIFDGGFKANRRNLKILKSYFEEQGLI
jgi:Domain of unknown function (DUF4112)